MTTQKIDLKFESTLPRISGNPYGKEIYNEQLKPLIEQKKINLEEGLIITFPDYIEFIASSFNQGFFSNLISRIGYDGLDKYITIKKSNVDISEEIFRDLIQ